MPTASEWAYLREQTSWTIYESDIFDKAIEKTLYAVTVFDQKQVIGMGRVVGDGIICFYIQDVVVDKNYRNKGIGKCIINNLLQQILQHAQNNASISLLSAKGTEYFYEKLGFVLRPNEFQGAGMSFFIKSHSS